MFKTAEVVLSAAVVTDGTFTVAYPDGTDSGTYVGSKGHKMWVAGHQKLYDYGSSGFTWSLGTSSITVTYKGSTSIAAGTRVSFQLETVGPDSRKIETRTGASKRTSVMTPVVINLGAPDASSQSGVADGVAAQGVATLYFGVSGVGITLDCPRNILNLAGGAITGVNGTATYSGYDEYGNAMKETITVSGAVTGAGKKAFKRVVSAALSGLTVTGTTLKVGFGDVLGLPVYLGQKGWVVKEMEDGALATAGTLLAGITGAQSATTGDVRGTYDPNSAADAAKAFQLLAYVEDPSDLGEAQYNG